MAVRGKGLGFHHSAWSGSGSLFGVYSNRGCVESSFRTGLGFSLQILLVWTEPNVKQLERTKLRNGEKWAGR